MTSQPIPALRLDPRGGGGAPPLLTLEDLRVYFKTQRGVAHAVEGVSFTIDNGEALALVGETGSGKTVTARSLIRLVPVPPGIFAGGRSSFHPTMPCPGCPGEGCPKCDGTRQIPAPCKSCGGAGCAACDQSGLETLDLLTISDRAMRNVRGNHISMVFQDPDKALNPALSVRQQIAEVFTLHRSDEILRDAGLDGGEGNTLLTREARGQDGFFTRRLLGIPPIRARHKRLQGAFDERIIDVLRDTRIPSPIKVMNSYPHELSGGMKQRVMIAMALACEPDLFIADEPTTSLDVTIQARILDLISDLQSRHHASVLYITHDLAVVRAVADRVAVMYAGQLVEVGPTEEILSEPMHPYTRGLIAARPQARRRRGELQAIRGTVPELIDPKPACRFASRCDYAASICRRRDPVLTAQESGDHQVACFLYDSAEKVGAQDEEMPVEATP